MKGNAHPRRVMIIDDNADDRELYERALRKADDATYQTFSAADGRQGLELLQRVNPDCVLLDYSLPGANGLEILKEIREQWAEVPVVVLTGQGNEAVAVAAMKEGAQDYIIKSRINGELLHRVIQNACDHQALQRQVAQQRDALKLFTGALAHDLKEPLRTISSFATILSQESHPSEDHRDYLEHIRNAAAHMERLVDSVRAYTGLDSDSRFLDVSVLPPEQLVRQALNNLKVQLAERPNRVEVGQMPLIRFSRAQGVALFQNLISNALNYGDKPITEIRIWSRVEDGQALIVVEDNGPGIRPQHREDIFRPFKRFAVGARRGTGLGLAICRKVVDWHGGRIWAESTQGQGSRFYIALPAMTPQEQVDPSPEPGRAEAPPATKRLANVLVVEDNPADVKLTEILLQDTDRVHFNLFAVDNGEQALAFLKDPERVPIDLILLDINMPVMDGFSFLKAMRSEAPAAPPVVLCSTSDDELDRNRAAELGAVGYLTKPVRLETLRPSLRRVETLELTEQGEQVLLRVV